MINQSVNGWLNGTMVGMVGLQLTNQGMSPALPMASVISLGAGKIWQFDQVHIQWAQHAQHEQQKIPLNDMPVGG